MFFKIAGFSLIFTTLMFAAFLVSTFGVGGVDLFLILHTLLILGVVLSLFVVFFAFSEKFSYLSKMTTIVVLGISFVGSLWVQLVRLNEIPDYGRILFSGNDWGLTYVLFVFFFGLVMPVTFFSLFWLVFLSKRLYGHFFPIKKM